MILPTYVGSSNITEIYQNVILQLKYISKEYF